MNPIRTRFTALLVFLTVCGAADARVWYVDVRSVTLAPTGLDWGRAFPTIQQGIDAASNDGGGEVWVRWGRYDETRFAPVDGEDAGSLTLRSEVEVYGGFRGDETQRSQRDWNEYPTVIDGSIARQGFLPAYHVVFAAPNSRLDGFTIEGGDTLAANAINGWGGGVLAIDCTGFSMANCLVQKNSASIGGGVFIFSGTDITLTNNRIHDNFVLVSGAGLYVISGADVDVVNTVIDRNRASLTSNVNTFGGGVVCEQGSLVDIWHCTIWDNIAENANGIGAFSASAVTIRNSIIWSLETLQIATGGLATLSIQSSVVKGGFTGANNLNVDPLLASPARGDFKLRTNSPCIDAATANGAPAATSADREGLSRPLRNAPDIGAHELPYIGHVDKSAPGIVQDGQSWETAFTDIQPALDAISATGGEVWVARGVYGEDRSASQPDGALKMRLNTDVYGEFAGFETYRSARRLPDLIERDPIYTVIDGAVARGGLPAYHVVRSAANARLDGFRIINGVANGSNSFDKNGGGIFAVDNEFTVANCQIIGNTAENLGGGAHWRGFSRWDNVLVLGNSAALGGGIAFNETLELTLTNAFILANTATSTGGGVHTSATEVTMRHCAVLDNSANSIGGVARSSGVINFQNGIIRGNSGGQVSQDFRVRVQNSNVQGGSGSTNIDANPRFYSDEPPYDLRLDEASPSIDAGHIDYAPGHDVLGRERERRFAPDHGPHEMRPVVYVDLDNDNALVQDGTNWARAFTFLQDAIDEAVFLRGADLWVAEGVYREQRSSVVEDVDTGSLRLAPHVDLYGGFQNGEVALIDRNIRTRPTTISGLGTRGGADAMHTILGADFAVVDGFTIRNGRAQTNAPHNDGGGIWNRRASMTLRNSVVRNNIANGNGGAIFNQFSDLRLENVVVFDNTSNDGAIANDTAWMIARHLTVADNSGTPGALRFDDSEGVIGNSILWFNGPNPVTSDAESSVMIRASNIEGGFAGTGNINLAPLFENRGGRNYRLNALSPGLDVASVNFGLDVDADHEFRPGGITFDMGAFEAPDTDGDGILDDIEGTADPDRDGLPNFLDDDSDGDGILDRVEGPTDSDGDLVPDFLDEDSDNDTLLDIDEGDGDPDGDLIPNFRDTDSDNDTLSDSDEVNVHNTNPYAADSDSGGVNDAFEIQSGTNPNNPADDLSTIDVNGDTMVNAADIQAVINAVLGQAPTPNTDVNRDGVTNATDIQLTILAVLGLL